VSELIFIECEVSLLTSRCLDLCHQIKSTTHQSPTIMILKRFLSFQFGVLRRFFSLATMATPHMNLNLSLTGQQYFKKKSSPDQKEIIFLTSYQVILFRYSHVENIPLLNSNILELDLQNCQIKDMKLITKFIHLKFLCLSNNSIETIPSSLNHLTSLTFCDLSSNLLKDLHSIHHLRLISSLKYLNLNQNPLTKAISKYRLLILELCPSLLALDFHLYSDEERYPFFCRFHGTKYTSCSPQLSLEPFLRVTYPKQSRTTLVLAHNARLHSLYRLISSTSPLALLKKSCKKWLRYAGLRFFIPQITRLQALIRRFLFNCRINKAVEQINLENSELEHEYRFIRYGYLTKFVILIQRQWRVALQFKRQTHAVRCLQRWYRSSILYHKGCVEWLHQKNVQSIIFPRRYEEIVMRLFQQLIDHSPPQSSTRNILEQVCHPVPIKKTILTRAKGKFLQWDGNFKVKTEFLFIALPRSRRQNFDQLDSAENEAEEGKLDHHTSLAPINKLSKSSTKTRSWFFSPCLCYANQQQRKLLFLLKRRGCRHSPSSLTSSTTLNNSSALNRIIWNSKGGGNEKDPTRVTKGDNSELHKIPRRTYSEHQQQKYSFWLKAHRLSQLLFPPQHQSLIWKVYKRLCFEILNHVDEVIPLYFNFQMTRQLAVIEMQRLWRGYVKRKHMSLKFIEKILISRSAILLQRWWRVHNSLKRRTDLLSLIERRCHDICDKRLYLDSMVFYRLLRLFKRPQQASLRSSPEYRGIPLVDPQTGCVVYQPLLVDSTSMMKHCIPLWASWRPSIQLSPIKPSAPINNYHQIIADLISSHCEVSLEHFPVPLGPLGQKGERQFARSDPEFRIVELVFSSISEAKIRCAMLMLQTYDCVSRSCVAMMTRDFVKRKIRESRGQILAGPSLNRNTTTTHDMSLSQGIFPLTSHEISVPLSSTEIIPVEGYILLTDLTPSWLIGSGSSESTVSSLGPRDMIRYRFMCESLSKRNTYKAKNEERLETALHSPAPPTALVSTNERKYEILREMITQQLRPPLAYDSLTTHRLEAVQFHSPREAERERKVSVTDVHAASIDERLQRHLWDSKRVVGWCAEFPEEHKSSSNLFEDQTLLNNVDRVITSRLDLIQHSQYERVMSSVSPRQQQHHRLLPLDYRSRSPSPPAHSPTHPHPVPPLSPSSPRQLESNNPRAQWEQNHRKKIQEIRNKKFLQKQEFQEKEMLSKQEKEAHCQQLKEEKEKIKLRTKEIQKQKSHLAHRQRTQQRELAQTQQKINFHQDLNKKLKQKELIDQEKKLNRISANKIKEIQETHAVLFAMDRHGFNDQIRIKEKRILENKQEKVHEQRLYRNTHRHHQRPQSAYTNSRTVRNDIQEIERGSSTIATVQYHRMITQFEERNLQQKGNEILYRRGHSVENEVEKPNHPTFAQMDDDVLSSSGSGGFESQGQCDVLTQNRMIISVGAISVDEYTDNTSLINLDSPRDTAIRIRQGILMKTFPSFRTQFDDDN
jgi:hypothetical protein